MSSSNRYNLFTHAENASREHSPVSSDADGELLGEDPAFEYSPPHSPLRQSPSPQSPDSAAPDSAETAPATSGPADVAMTEAPGDTTAATPDLSMEGVRGSLPAVFNKRDFWNAFEKAGSAALEAVEASKARRIQEGQSSSSVGVTIPSAARDLQPEQEAAFDPRSIRNPKWMRCAFMYSTVEDARIPVGNPFGTEKDGCHVTLGIDAGRFGPAHITLRFRIERKKQAASKEPKEPKEPQLHQFEATWRIGVVIDGAKMIDNMTIQSVNPDNTVGPGEGFRSVPVEAKCPKERESSLPKLMAINFNSNSVRLDQVDENVFNGLKPEVQDTMKALFYTQGPFQMTIWFVAFPSPSAALREWGDHLLDAESFPPFWPYYYGDQETVNCTLAETPDIRSFAGGMLCVYPPIKLENGRMEMDEDGRPREDRTRPPRYHNFPRQLNWDQEAELGIFASIPVIRGVQFDKGQVAHIGTSAHKVFLLNVPMFKVPGKASKEVRDLAHAFYAFVRMSPNKNVLQESTPTEGMRIKLEWDNSDPSRQKPHVQTNKRQNHWFGTVINHEAGCKTTGTHFCVWLNRPFGSTSRPQYFTELRYLPNQQLPSAWMMVEVDTTAAEREINAAKLLADKTFNPERLGEIRVALMQEPSRMTHSQINLTTLPNIDTNMWEEWKNFFKGKYADNPSQFEVLEELEHIDNRMTGIVGPPGAGKTEVLTDSMNGAVMMGHKVLVTAVSNKAVDNAAIKMWNSFPESHRRIFKFLRLETNSTENCALLARQGFQDLGADVHARPEYKAPTSLEEDDALAEVFSKAVADYSENQAKLAKLFQQFRDIDKALAEYRKATAKKESGVPARLTLANRIFDMALEDDIEAATTFEAEVDAYRSEPATEEEVNAAAAAGAPGPMLRAMRSEKLTEEEIQARVADNRIQSLEVRNPSSEYTKVVNDYIAAGGDLPKSKRQSFKTLRAAMVARVLKDTDVLFTTCNNSGSDVVKDVFQPTVIAIDEAGQLTMAAFAVVVTSYTSWEAIILFGDPKQLLPYLSSGRANEFKENAELSLLGLLEAKGSRIIFLNLQYRMAPSIADWPARYFYKGLLNNHPDVDQDNDTRRIGREIAKNLYRINGPQSAGSETWFVDVVHGVSRVQENGTSLQNYANADAIAFFIDRLIGKGVSADAIVILTYYSGQKSVLAARLAEFARAKGRPWAGTSFEISIIDAYQGQEKDVVIADFVVSTGIAKGFHDLVDEESGDEANPSTKDGMTVSAFVKNAHRLCCLCTRAKSVFVLFGQLTALLSTGQNKQRRSQAAVSRMMMDYRKRRLVYHDTKHLDTSPQGIAERASWGEARQAHELKIRAAQSTSYLNTKVSNLEKGKVVEEHIQNPPRVWRTKHRRTKRPVDIGMVSEAADRHDIDNAQDKDARLSVKDPNATQRQKKELKKATAAAKKKAAEEKAEKSGTGKGKAIYGPPQPQDKGKSKDTEMKDAPSGGTAAAQDKGK